MTMRHTAVNRQMIEGEWVTFPGGELEGTRPKVLCHACRASREAEGLGEVRAALRPALCFQCYRAGLERERAIQAAGQLDTASSARFQAALPFEPVNRARLAQLRAERGAARVAARAGIGQYVDKRRRAQIHARHVLQRIAHGLVARGASPVAQQRVMARAIHAAELQLPEAWLPFVVAR